MEKVFYHSGHISLWDWLSKNPTKYKWEWPGWNFCCSVVSDCFACEYDENFEADCTNCPFEGDYSVNRDCLNGLYGNYCASKTTKDYERAKYFAEKIRDLPVREDVEVC